MKFTAKQYQENIQVRKALKNDKEDARMCENWDTYKQMDDAINELQQNYFDKAPSVCASFYIGYRKYYEEVVKIGKAYFCNGTKMTKSRGFRSIVEIPEITDRMASDMLADSYYY